MRNWCTALRSWLRRSTPPARPGARRPLAVESLEARLAPAANPFAGTTPYRGSGYSVAVLDTGINYNLPDLGGGWGKRVVAGYDFLNNDADPMDDNGHGTHVAGIIGSASAAHPGIAPDVNLIALKVLDSNAVGNWTAIGNALKWVAEHQAQYNIVAVNMSFSTGNYTSLPSTLLEQDLATVKNQGVFISAAAGNRYFTYQVPGLAYPALSPLVVSVGAVWTDYHSPYTWSSGAQDTAPTVDRIVSVTQRSGALDLLAPGACITSNWHDGRYRAFGGTSMATAVVSGAAALMHQAYDVIGQHAMTGQDNLLGLMQSTGKTIVDVDQGGDNVPHTGLSFQRLDIAAALDRIGLPSPPALEPIADVRSSHARGPVTLDLAATDAHGLPITYAAELPAGGQSATLSINGNRLTIVPATGYAGTFAVKVTASNGYTSSSTTFNVTIANSAPVLSAIADQALSDRRVLTLSATDADGDALRFSARVVTQPSALHDLNQQLRLQPHNGSYYENLWGAGEKWLVGSNNVWYALLADGRLYRWAGTMTATLQPAYLTASLGSAVHADPRLLWQAQPPQAPPVRLEIAGNQLTIAKTAPFAGSFTVEVIVSDGSAAARRTFTVTATEPPTLTAIPAQTMAAGSTLLSVSLSAGLTYTARVLTPDASLYQLSQQLRLRPANGSYHENLGGANEKWLISSTGAWYALLPDGRLYRWGGTFAATLQPANLTATLPAAVYAEPRLLWQAAPPQTPALTLSLQQDRLVIDRPSGLLGVFLIEVTASDGQRTTFHLVLD